MRVVRADLLTSAGRQFGGLFLAALVAALCVPTGVAAKSSPCRGKTVFKNGGVTVKRRTVGGSYVWSGCAGARGKRTTLATGEQLSLFRARTVAGRFLAIQLGDCDEIGECSLASGAVQVFDLRRRKRVRSAKFKGPVAPLLLTTTGFGAFKDDTGLVRLDANGSDVVSAAPTSIGLSGRNLTWSDTAGPHTLTLGVRVPCGEEGSYGIKLTPTARLSLAGPVRGCLIDAGRQVPIVEIRSTLLGVQSALAGDFGAAGVTYGGGGHGQEPVYGRLGVANLRTGVVVHRWEPVAESGVTALVLSPAGSVAWLGGSGALGNVVMKSDAAGENQVLDTARVLASLSYDPAGGFVSWVADGVPKSAPLY